MENIDIVRNSLIDRIMLTDNEQLLSVIDGILNSTQTEDKLTLDAYQIEMLMMSERDIEEGRLISEEDLEKEDSEWMR
ncbi:MAG: hypothetical protein ACK5IQ_07910 [Bacteroidales bacterium]